GNVELAFVHHTENPDGYSAAEVPAMLRSIFVFHRYTHGWNDIGYNFVIDRFGRTFEARAGGISEPVIGAHAGGYNAYSTGVAILGTYSAQRISPAALAALERLLAWKLSLHGAPVEGRVTVRVTPGGAVYSRFPANTPVSLPRVAGHRDADSTDCPGDALYGELSSLRRGALRLAGRPARATLLSQTAESAAGPSTALAGSLRFLDGTPIVGAPVEIRQRVLSHRGESVTELVLARAVTGPDGRWSLPVAIAPSSANETALRAVSTGGSNLPVAVSDQLLIGGAVSFTVPAAPAPAQAPTPGQAPAPTAPESAPPAA
ncbi:MAG TPA: N-acetylmuramoyl-L-alanine amidase, partial [Solirubrobacteraceae bacterium]|nr:N-acetylmuramoyl-L-alanine amidase [Solirubrobacteraceae bacterium]